MYALRDVTKIYRRGKEEVVAFRAPALTVDRGEYVAVIGPSGSGKTTLLSLLGGMLSPTSGELLFQGTPLFAISAAQRAKLRLANIGFVFQSFNLVPYLSALENVEVPLYLAGKTPAAQRARATALLEQFGLADRMHHKPWELSVGQQQRVALARTLANDPPVILADEPTGNLDPSSRGVVLDCLDDFHRQGRTILMVTHDLTAAARAQRRLSLDGGTLADQRTTLRRTA